MRGAWNVFEACRDAGRRRAVVFASSDKAYGSSPRAALPRGLPAARRLSLRRQQGRGGHRRPQLRPRLRPAAGGHPLRQHLRRRRPQLLAADSGDGGRRARRARPDDPLRRQPRARLPPRRRRGLRLPGDRGRARRRERQPRARPSTRAASARTRCARWSRRSPALAEAAVEPDFQGDGNPDGEIDRQYVDSSKLRELTGWRPAVELREGLRARSSGTGDNPGEALDDPPTHLVNS